MHDFSFCAKPNLLINLCELLQSHSQVLRKRAIDKVLELGFYGVSIDETTDVRVRSISSVIARVCNQNGVAEECFLGIFQLHDGCADTIHAALLTFIHEQGLPIEDLISLCTDGASSMAGVHAGVAARMRAINAGLMTFHCVNHR